MKRIFGFSIAALAATAALFVAACSDDDNNTNTPTPGANGTVLFTTASNGVYRTTHDSTTGSYEVTLGSQNDELFLVFVAPKFESTGHPTPEAGTYAVAAEAGAMTIDTEQSYWISTSDGMEVKRKIVGGSFILGLLDGSYSLEGELTGSGDAVLKFAFSGQLLFADYNGEPLADAIQCQSARGTFYGSYYIPNASDYYIVLFDTLHAAEGDPYNYRICLDFTSGRTAGSLMPALGTYYPDGNLMFDEFTFLPGLMNGANGTLWQIPSSSGGATRYMVTDGFFTLRAADNGKYQVFGTLKDNYGKEISFNYVGALPFVNDAVGTFTSLTENYDMGQAYYVNQKCTSTSDEGNIWAIYFYDEQSWTSKGAEGHFVKFEIPLTTDHKAIPAGTYSAAAHVLYPEQNNYVPGYIFAYDTSLATANGSWLARGNGTNSAVWAPLRKGDLVLEVDQSGVYTATFTIEDDDYIPHTVSGSFKGEIPLTSDSKVQSLAVPAPVRNSQR